MTLLADGALRRAGSVGVIGKIHRPARNQLHHVAATEAPAATDAVAGNDSLLG